MNPTYDPARFLRRAIGFNTDSTVSRPARRVYRYYADQDVGITLSTTWPIRPRRAAGAFGAIIVEPAVPSTATRWTARPRVPASSPTSSRRRAASAVRGLLSDEDDVIGRTRCPIPPWCRASPA